MGFTAAVLQCCAASKSVCSCDLAALSVVVLSVVKLHYLILSGCLQTPNWVDKGQGNIVAYANFSVLIAGSDVQREPNEIQLFEFSG